MTRRRFRCGLAIALLGGCALGPEPDSRATRFDPACRFVPDGMTSLWFIDDAAFVDTIGDPAWTPVLTLKAGRRFRPSGVGYGDAELVEVQLWGKGGVPPIWPDDALSMEPIEGAKVWFHPGNGEGLLEDWYAIVGSQLSIHTSRRALLVEALRRRGPGAAVLATRLGWSDVDWHANEIILRQYDPTDQADVWSPCNTTTPLGPGPRGFDIRRIAYEQRSTSRTGEYRFRADTGDPKRTLEFFAGAVNLVGASRAEWRSATCTDRALLVEDAWARGEVGSFLEIFLALLFGMNVFI